MGPGGMTMRSPMALLIITLLLAVEPARAVELEEWCSSRCTRVFGPGGGKPDCSLTLQEHEVVDGKVVLVEKPDPECEAEHARWRARQANLRAAREGLLDREGCLSWCAEVGALRRGEPLPDEATHLWDLLADVEVCDSGEVDPQFLGLVPLQFRCNGMVFVAPGKFMMGCVESRLIHCRERETPLHVVYLPGYLVDQHEVTVGAYQRCVSAGRCSEPPSYESLRFFNWGNPARLLHPVNGVTWAQADAYCRFDGKRLCTEAEWEKGARGTDGRVYPWGDSLPDERRVVLDHGLDYGEEKRPWPLLTTTEQVCSYPEGNSPYGLCDMAGNVWEWVADWYGEDYYEKSPMVAPQGPETGTLRVIRGGRFYRVGFYLRASNRGFFQPESDFAYLGFRCCMTLEGGEEDEE